MALSNKLIKILKKGDGTCVIDGVTYVDFSGNIRDVMHIPIHLTGNKIAYLIVPVGISEAGVKIIEHHLEQIKLRLELEEKTEEHLGHSKPSKPQVK